MCAGPCFSRSSWLHPLHHGPLSTWLLARLQQAEFRTGELASLQSNQISVNFNSQMKSTEHAHIRIASIVHAKYQNHRIICWPANSSHSTRNQPKASQQAITNCYHKTTKIDGEIFHGCAFYSVFYGIVATALWIWCSSEGQSIPR